MGSRAKEYHMALILGTDYGHIVSMCGIDPHKHWYMVPTTLFNINWVMRCGPENSGRTPQRQKKRHTSWVPQMDSNYSNKGREAV